jgi:NifU-like protein involved in Fe-S cluster formation
LELQKIEEIVENGELKEENSPLNLFNLIADFPTRLNCVLLETKNLLNFLKAI